VKVNITSDRMLKNICWAVIVFQPRINTNEHEFPRK
jgi:hypothetical protein